MTNWLKTPNGTNAATVVTFDRAVIDRAGQARFSVLLPFSDYKYPNHWDSLSGSASELGKAFFTPLLHSLFLPFNFMLFLSAEGP